MAADWFGDLLRSTDLARRVEETLNLPPAEGHEKIRAAASVLVALGRGYIWPVAQLNRHLDLAIARLETIRQMDIYRDSPGIISAIDEEIAVLRSRIKLPKK